MSNRTLLTNIEAAKYLSVSVSWLNKSRLTGKGPRYYKLSHGRVAYDLRDLDEWLDARRVYSTSDPLPAASGQ
jgi:predicted DNA-binding transcriptional regulator AlpA